MVVTLTTATSVAYVYKAETFEKELTPVDAERSVQVEAILTAFHRINNRGTQLSFFVSLILIGFITSKLSESISRPLRQMENAIQEINSGRFRKVPSSGIPELNRIGGALNVAASQMQTAEEIRKMALSDLAHELNSPLSVIRGYLELVDAGKMNLTPSIGHQLQEEAERMSRLIADLSILAKAEAGTLVLHQRCIDPVQILTALVQAMGIKNQKNVQICLDCPQCLPEIWVDPDRFRQIVINLLSNALHYTNEGRISIRAGADDQEVWIEISDTGIGISKKELTHIFDRFWRSEDSRQQNKEGSGLGLAITKKLVEAQGGQIFVDSQLGLGTTFRIRFSRSSLTYKPEEENPG